MITNRLKYITRVLGLALTLTVPTACSDFLDETDPSNLQPESFFTIPDHAEAVLAATYSGLRFWGDGAGIFSANWQMLEAVTGTATTQTGQNSDLNNLYGLIHQASTGHIGNFWNGLYRIIANANLAIEKIPGINFPDETQKQRLLAEARFLRAWSYFNVVRLWGDAPLILTPQTAASEDFFPSRTPQEEIYEFVVNELKAAEAAGLPDFRTDGRVSNVAVKSLLAKVYLTMAGYPLQKGASHYSLAAEKALEVINFSKANPSTLNLFPTYADLRNEDLKNRVEHIFQIQYNTVVAGFPLNDMLPNQTAVTYAGPSGTGSTVPTVSFYNSYEAGDLRTKNQVGYFYDTYYVNGTGAPFDLGQPHIFKYFNQKALGGPGINPTRLNNLNVNLIRFAEVLLIYAEAQNEAGGLNQEAYDALKRIRDRAQLTTPPIGSFTQNSFREAVWKERWMEFCYEQITWFDMIRLRKVWNETNRNFDDFVGHRNLNISGGALLEEKHLLFPIPLAEMQNNPNLRPQNPGYVAAPN
mgnify:CR=1 FL=1